MEKRDSPFKLLSRLLLHDPFEDPFFHSSLSSFLDPFLCATSRHTGKGAAHEETGNLRIEEIPVQDKSTVKRAPSPIVEHPDDDAASPSADIHSLSSKWMDSLASLPNSQAYTYSSSSVCYGGPQGVYYAAEKTRRGGPKGILEEKFEERDTNASKHMKRISRCLGNQGHTYTAEQNLRSGEVNQKETLHNLKEGDVANFDKMWEEHAEKSFRVWKNDNRHLLGRPKSVQRKRAMASLPFQPYKQK